MGQTLVLNASYEPLNITSWRRSVILMIKGKAIETNVRQLRSKLSKNCQFMAVVKADGYGHDAKLVSEYAIKGGASQLGVATLNEGIKLRSSGVKKPILILGNLYTKRDLIISFKNDLMPTISSIRECLICNNIGKHFGLKFSCLLYTSPSPRD